MFGLDPRRICWWLALVALSLSSCDGYGKIEARKDATSVLLLYGGQLSPDGRQAAFSDDDVAIGVWDDASRKLRCGNTSTMTFATAYWCPGSRQFALIAPHVSPRNTSELLFVNVADLSIEKRLTTPFDPRIVCFFDTDVVGACASYDKWNEPDPLTLFRLGNDRLVATQTLKHPAGNYNVLSAARITNRLGLFCVRLLPDASAAQADAPRRSGAPEASTPDNEKSKLNIEACVFDVVSGRLVQRVAGPAPVLAPWSRIAVAGNGKHALFYSDDAIEIRELPSLRLSSQLNIKRLSTFTDDPVFSLAVSHDARYVAFGSDQLQLWDTRTSTVQTLDAMRSNTLRAMRNSLFPSEDPLEHISEEFFARRQYCLADIRFIEDSSKFAMVTHDGTYAVWDADSGACLRRDHIAKVVYLTKDAWWIWYPSQWCFCSFVVYSVVVPLWWVIRYRRSLVPLRLSARPAYVMMILCGIGFSMLVAAYLLKGQWCIWQPSHAYIFVFPAYAVIALSCWVAWYRRSLMRLQFSLGSVFVLVALCAIGLSILAPAFR
jgi:hypothetical protein